MRERRDWLKTRSRDGPTPCAAAVSECKCAITAAAALSGAHTVNYRSPLLWKTVFLPLWATRKAHPGIETSRLICLFKKHLACLCPFGECPCSGAEVYLFSRSDLREKAQPWRIRSLAWLPVSSFRQREFRKRLFSAFLSLFLSIAEACLPFRRAK